jgi:hypothetical protein
VSDEPTIDLAYIGHAMERLITEVATLRDDMTLLTAIVHRMDNSQSRILEELRAMHRQHGRLAHRVEKLERAEIP